MPPKKSKPSTKKVVPKPKMKAEVGKSSNRRETRNVRQMAADTTTEPSPSDQQTRKSVSIPFYDPIFDNDEPNSDYDADPLPLSDIEIETEDSDVSDHSEAEASKGSPVVLADVSENFQNPEEVEVVTDYEDHNISLDSSVVEIENAYFPDEYQGNSGEMEDSVCLPECDYNSEESSQSPIIYRGSASQQERLVIEALIDDDEAEFNSLQNANTSQKIVQMNISDFDRSIIHIPLDSEKLALGQVFPGVYASAFDKSSGVAIGILKLDPKTIKPFERVLTASIVYTLLLGEVILKSAMIEEMGNTNVLTKQVVEQGTCLKIPVGHPYALENRTDNKVILQYAVIPIPAIPDQ